MLLVSGWPSPLRPKNPSKEVTIQMASLRVGGQAGGRGF